MNVHSLSNTYVHTCGISHRSLNPAPPHFGGGSRFWGAQAASLPVVGSLPTTPAHGKYDLALHLRRAFRQAAERTGWQPVLPRDIAQRGASRFRVEGRFHRLMRHDRRRLRRRVETSEGVRRWLANELQDRRGYAQNACGINRCFHDAPALLL